MSFLSVFTSSAAPPAAGPDRLSMPTRWLWIVALASLAWRGWMAAVVPLTGDEALFYWWARFLDYGYYDHPPMVAWWIAGMRALLGDAEWAIRMPAVLLPLGVGWALWWAWSPVSRERAAWAVLLYWLAPVNWLNALIATDSPLILWAAWATAALVRAEQAADRGRSPWGLYTLSGFFMGLAFLSKYFAVLLGMAFVVYFALFARARWRALVLIVLAALPAVAVNLLWNLQHCWTNIMFNLFNRNEGAEASPANVMVYLVMMAYLISPVLLWLGWRHRSAWRTELKGQALLVCAALVPLALFGLLAVKKEIGLHWVMGFYPFIFVMWVWALPASALRTAARGLGVFLVVHLLVAGGAALSDLSQWQRMKPHVRLVEKNYHRFVEAVRAKEMVKQVQVPGVVLASNAYSAASIFGYAAGHHVPVLGRGSLHARQDDLIVDYAALDGQTIRVMATRNLSLADYRGFFESVRLLTFQQDGATFYVLEGVNFSYAAYRKQVMAEVNRRYYAFPSWLPVWSCSFCQRYCGANRCAP